MPASALEAVVDVLGYLEKVAIRRDAMPVRLHPQSIHERDETPQDLRYSAPARGSVDMSDLEPPESVCQPFQVPEDFRIHQFTVGLKVPRTGFYLLQHSVLSWVLGARCWVLDTDDR